MATYNELEQRIKELKSRTGKGSISPRETFDLMDELLSKTKGVDMTAQPLVVVKSYDTLALANADRNPINPATNKPLALGQLISITADGTNNAVYRLALLGSDGSPTWEKQAELGDMTNYAKQTDLVQLAGEMIKDMLLSESFMPQSATYTDGLINSPFNVIWVDGATGVVAVTRNSDNLATNIVATHILGDVTKTITCEITRDADGNATDSTITIN